MQKLITALVLTALLVTPTLPAWADGGPAAPGLFGWLQGWLDTAMSWVTGEAGPTIDPSGLQGDGTGSEAGPLIDPNGLQDDQCTEESTGDGGPCIDPMG